MNRNQFFYYLENIDKLDAESVKHLKELVIEYPYFQVARIMLAKNLHDIDDIKYQFELKQTAIHIPDRKQLYLLINSTKQSELKLIKDANPKISVTEQKQIEKEKTLQNPTENYFGVTDEVEMTQNTINFSAPQYNVGKQPIDSTLPDSNLFDYELTPTSSYRLEESFVDASQSRSFMEWLEAMSHAHVLPEKEEEKLSTVNRQMDLIESFLQKEQGKIVPRDEKVSNPVVDISGKSVAENDELMTETLANIHIKQKHYDKAIEIFEKLILKYPEKNIYFASRIKEIEKLINNQ